MATNKKTAEAGWFYHAPHKSNPNQEPVGAPPASQIPGLSDLSDVPVEDTQRKMWIKDSDSDYVILAKQGGRPDLLRYRSPKPRSEEPQGYPRCDWYYHDTGADSPQKDKPTEPYDFLLPDYMVHSEWSGGKQNEAQGKGAPFAYDTDSAFVRDQGKNPTDKTVRLPEIQPTGYGVRAGKMHGRRQTHAPIERVQPIKPTSELDQDKLKYEPIRTPKDDFEPVMGKLLSHGYISEWEADRDRWNSKQQKNQEKFDAKNHRPNEKFQTEYQSSMMQGTKAPKPGTSESRQRSSDSRQKHQPTREDHELFKLSKFKNVSSKTDNRRVPDFLSHDTHYHQSPADVAT